MITFKEYLFFMSEYDIKPFNYKPSPVIGSGGGAKLNPMKAVNPARPHTYKPLFKAGSKKNRISQKPSFVAGK